jgi:GNAT superfamily N-acetyltransferase
LTEAVEEFLAEAGEFLHVERARNTVLLTVTETLRAKAATGNGAGTAGAVTRTVAGMVRVGPVYTPPELRGRGYAGAVTATVSHVALDAGVTDVLLYTDLANPTSNALYQRIGYRPVEDRVMLSFG